jgi:uncharacterized repeat protein (TIGR02543 family)
MNGSKITFGNSFELFVPTKEGYTFKGWYELPNGEGIKFTDHTGKLLFNWNVASDITLYPYFESK